MTIDGIHPIEVADPIQLNVELRRAPDLTEMPIYNKDVTGDQVELIEESFVRGIMAERLPLDADHLECTITPRWQEAPPLLQQLQVTLTASTNGQRQQCSQSFSTGRWARTAQKALAELLLEGAVSANELVYTMLLGLVPNQPPPLQIASLQRPTVLDQTLEQCGVRRLGIGNLDPDRPVLINHRLVADAIRRCETAGSTEAGAAVLGKIVRLPEPLPGTRTRIVTLLSTLVEDPRHEGESLSIHFSPQALADAAEIAEMRGLGESVQTVYHSHGWKPECPGCQAAAKCGLAKAAPSLQDYQVLESLFSSKTTLMPIAGRKSGTQDQQPTLNVFAWCGGQLQTIRWQQFED